jgi:hypothetical protein
MKKFLVLVLLTAGLACDKPVILSHNDTTQHHPDNDITGEWVLELTSTRMGSVTSIKIQLDNNKLVFLPSASCCDIPTVTYSRI